MTEPEIGSDLASMRTTAIATDAGDSFVLNGSKTFITNGINADLVIVAAKTDPSQRHKGISLLIVERGMDGFSRGRNLEKIGMHSQDTAELFFNDVFVPEEDRLGEEGQGFLQLVSNLPRERLSIAIAGISSTEAIFAETVEYVKARTAFGKSIGSFQNTRFVLAEIKAEIELVRNYIDRSIEAQLRRGLSPEDAAIGKWWATEMQGRAVDRCLQLFGGYGYMLEYPVARAFQDARVSRIYGGTTEVMKEIVGRSLGL
jgi:alkylation response protein AidB-like acyl-CoA dehydrogenase